ncbi:peptide deformylase [Gorillibacterium massiliense]|uniref:peptide deformylase n=1 Tax=Gorillibacterium massiliense TaxID=1280390 RepID=UPI0004B7F9B2|nr:peptide deformylase [Gorillibacterium massiliense]
MAIRIIVKHPDPVLRDTAKPVTKFTSNIHKLLDDMAETMYDAPGVGLAAPQIGILKRVVVIDVGDDNGLLELINPEILSREGEQLGPEGCLSIPGLVGEVRRANVVKIKAQDRNGKEFEMVGEGYLARAMQHEIDHLNGVLFIDIADKLYREEERDDRDDQEG